MGAAALGSAVATGVAFLQAVQALAPEFPPLVLALVGQQMPPLVLALVGQPPLELRQHQLATMDPTQQGWAPAANSCRLEEESAPLEPKSALQVTRGEAPALLVPVLVQVPRRLELG